MSVGNVHRVADQFERMGAEAAEHAFEDRTHSAVAYQADWLTQIKEHIYAHPVRAVLAGVGLGLLLGAVIVRR